MDTVGGIVGSFTVTHRFSTGGIFDVTMTVFDDDTGMSNVVKTQAWVTGVRLNPETHQLQVVGTNLRDYVKISLGSDGGSDGGTAMAVAMAVATRVATAVAMELPTARPAC